MEVQGTIIRITPIQEVGSKGFKKREVHIQTEEQYPQILSVEFVQDKCTVVDNFAEGEKVTIGINLRGREWTNKDGVTKVFNSIQGWKISKGETSEASIPAEPQVDDSLGDKDDLPF